MFDNIGDKVMTVAVVLLTIGVIASVIGAITIWCAVDGGFLMGLGVLAAGCFGSWGSSICLFGFGQLIESTEENNAYLRSISQMLSAQKGKAEGTAPQPAKPVVPAPQTTRSRAADWKCHKCGTSNPAGSIFCRDCGEYKL